MARPKRVQVTLNCPADASHKQDKHEQRVIEFGWKNPSTGKLQGGLIHFFPHHLLPLRVDLYRLDEVRVNIDEAQSLKMAMILPTEEESIIVKLGTYGPTERSQIANNEAFSQLLGRGLIKGDVTDIKYMVYLTDAGKYLYRQWKERRTQS